MSENILILGGSGYLGSVVTETIAKSGRPIEWPHLPAIHYTDIPILQKMLERATLVVNCAAFIPARGVSLCDQFKTKCIEGNAIFPARLAAMCSYANVPLIHLSTGCFYDESKEWTEYDTPLRSWGSHCGTYLHSKLMAERAVDQWEKSWILRLRLPFDEYEHSRNYLTKLCDFETVYRHINSMIHRQDFATAVLQFIVERPEFGIYHVVNHGQIAAAEVAERLLEAGIMLKEPTLVDSSHCCGCRLSTEKLRAAGIKMRHINEALDETIRQWKPKK